MYTHDIDNLKFQNFENGPKDGKNTSFDIKEGRYTDGIKSFNIQVSNKL